MTKKAMFTVDSGTYLIIDPCYLERFMRYFNYNEFASSQDPQLYIRQVAKKAFPKAEVNVVALVKDFGGDGVFSVTVSKKGTATIKRERG